MNLDDIVKKIDELEKINNKYNEQCLTIIKEYKISHIRFLLLSEFCRFLFILIKNTRPIKDFPNIFKNIDNTQLDDLLKQQEENLNKINTIKKKFNQFIKKTELS